MTSNAIEKIINAVKRKICNLTLIKMSLKSEIIWKETPHVPPL